MDNYLRSDRLAKLPRLPLKGILDLTYRCNNNCIHCGLRPSSGAMERQMELSTDEIKSIVNDARSMGCRNWSISGGEPMLRSDFPEIFDYVTSKSVYYSINTNGTLITPEIAKLMRRKGRKMVALYGATAEVHDHITRNPGSFQATMRGFELLKDVGAGFIVQLIPMKDNYYQFQDMVKLAKSLSPHWRVGAAWLYLSASGDPERNAEIIRQRLDPSVVVELDKLDISYEEGMKAENEGSRCHINKESGLFESCIADRRDFHIDPYGQMSFCSFIKDPELRYDLNKGSFRDGWDVFIPSLTDKIDGGDEYRENCGSCYLRDECRWCPVYGYLEHRRFSSKVDYLCLVARENRKFKKNYEENHCCYFSCAGCTIRFESDQPITYDMLHPTFWLFQSDGPREDMISVKLSSELPYLGNQDLGEVVFERGGWQVRKKGDSWIYLKRPKDDGEICSIATFNRDHRMVRIYGTGLEKADEADSFQRNNDLVFLTQTSLAHFLAERKGCFLHSSGVILGEKGVLFLGHSGAGKSTLRNMILTRSQAKPLCDDRNIVRRELNGYFVHGTWAIKDLEEVSAASLPLGAMMFVEQADENRIILLEDRMEIIKRLLPLVIRPVESAEWWDRSLALVGEMAKEVPCYRVRCDLSCQIVGMLEDICSEL